MSKSVSDLLLRPYAGQVIDGSIELRYMQERESAEDITDATAAKASTTGKKYSLITLSLLCLLPGGLVGIVLYKGYFVVRKAGKYYAENVTKRKQKKKTK